MPYKDKDQKRESDRLYRLKNLDKIKAMKLAHASHNKMVAQARHQRNKAKFNEVSRTYNHLHKERLNKLCLANYHANKEARQEKHQQWLKAHPGYMSAYARQKYAQDPTPMLAISQRRRARKAAAPRNDLTAAQWREILAAYQHCCVYCGRKMQRLEQDHIIPLSKGGEHSVSNVVPACRSCNSKKKDRAVLCPVQPLLLTIAKPRKTQCD